MVLLLATVLVSGCAETPPPSVPPIANAPSLDHLAGIDCIQGAGGSVGIAGTYGETPPPGWESPPGDDPLTRVFVRVLRCERLEWGALERPAHILLEYHQSFTPPETCREEGTSNFVLGTVWSDDPGLVAQALRFRMQAYLGNFSLETSNNQGIDVDMGLEC
jgi:hypothetical protein